MSDIDSLVHRYVEDRDALAPRELDELVAALKADSELAGKLRDQLILDDLLAQKLAVDRQNFVAQVEQRIADLNRGHSELNQQVADLRSLAAAEKSGGRSGNRRWRWTTYALALSVPLAAGLVIATVLSFNRHQPVIAVVKLVEGEVTVGREGEAETAKVNGELESGQRIVVPRGGLITFAYKDGTELRVKGDSAVTFGSEEPRAVKQIRIERGEVIANVKPQVAGPMRLTTSHAVAIAPASVLRLVVTDENTLLDVSEGQVKFDRLADNRILTVAANESGLASRDTLQIRQLTWPDRRDGLAYLFSPLESAPKENKPLTVVRNPTNRSLRPTPLEPRGAAVLSEARWFYELNGGYLFSGDAGPDIFAASRGGSELTLEAIISPASMEPDGSGRIVSLADENDDPDFALDQEGPEFIFCLRTDAKTPPPSPPKLSISASDSPLHLTVTYRDRELIAYRDGMEIARSEDVWGSLNAWRPGSLTVGANASGERPWRGIMEALALYNRCLEPGEVARNARNYRLLSRREM